MKRKYKKPPIVEALCEFQFIPQEPYNLTIPGLFYDKIKEEFPIRQEQSGLSFNLLQMIKGDVEVPILPKIQVAETLHQQNTEESFRTSVSRTYYGAFCSLRNLYGLKGHTKSNVHREVIEKLKASKDNTEQRIGKYIEDLRRERNCADYDDEKSVDKKISERCIIKAKTIFQLLNQPL